MSLWVRQQVSQPRVQAQAQRLAEAMARAQAPADPQIEWIDAGTEPSPQSVPRVTQTVVAASAEPKPAPTDDAWETVSQTTPTRPPSQATVARDRRALLDALLAEIRKDNDPAMERALDAALLTLGQPGRDIDRELIASLDGRQREQLARFQSMIQLFRHQLTTGDGELNRKDAEAAMIELFGAMPLEIRKVELCRKVEGYGVYEPFEGHTFLAGKDNKMIVYVELDNFTPHERGEEEYEVRLDQEVALYTDWDGQKVWTNPTQEIVDRSRNKRRDFFVVQMITLPARLGVGKYVLKVDVTDKHGGSIDTVPVEISLVADESLVRSDRERDRIKLIRQLLDEEDDQPLRDK